MNKKENATLAILYFCANIRPNQTRLILIKLNYCGIDTWKWSTRMSNLISDHQKRLEEYVGFAFRGDESKFR